MRHAMARCAIWALAGVTCLFAGQTSVTAAPAGHRTSLKPRPALWKIADTDTTIFLFGTTHALPPGFAWQSPAIKNIVRHAEELVVESLGTPDAQRQADQVVDAALSPIVEDRPILSRVAPEKRAALRRAIARTDFPEPFFDAMPSFMASLVLAVEDMNRDGRDQHKGVEAHLISAFQARGRPIVALEDGGAILRQMQGLSESAQQRMLEETLDDMEASPAAHSATADLNWVRGNTALLDAEFRREKLGDELYELLIVRRNQAWSQWLKDRLARPGTILFAVGAGHFAGPDALQRLLEQEGISVTRVD